MSLNLKVVFTSIVLMSSTPLSAAKFFDGYQALNMCQSPKPTMSAGCSMFIVGTAETLRMAGYNGVNYCVQTSISNKQLKYDFITYLNANTNALKYSATSLLYASLVQNHQCDKGQ